MMTSDKKVILTRVSNNKRNGYPQRWAVTIGEQIECSDFEDKVFIHDDFLTTWTERAIREEFDIGDYDRIVNNNSIRALAFDFKDDIYNIALVTIVSLREICNDLLNDMKMMPFSEREFADIVPMELDLIPVILSRYE